jgi:hypothetical protein
MSVHPSFSSTSIRSLSSGGPIPAPTACFGNSAPTLRNTTGMSGRVCQTNTELVYIHNCCGSDSGVRVQDNCTQYCETENDTFAECVFALFETRPLSQNVFCHVVRNDTSASVTTSSSTTSGATPSVGTSVVEVSTTVSRIEDEPTATGSAALNTEGLETSPSHQFQQLTIQQSV